MNMLQMMAHRDGPVGFLIIILCFVFLIIALSSKKARRSYRRQRRPITQNKVDIHINK
ncbi:MAG TPA: hypothetical protein VKR32_00595 [Puia sp.]|nr:hypothetical protein [Puia sp.]